MHENEERDAEALEDLAPDAQDESQVTGGATISDFKITKPIDKSSP